MINRLTIVGLGTRKGQLTEEAGALLRGQNVFFQTKRHPEYVEGAPSMDDLYDNAGDFDALNEAIANRLLAGGDDVVYAVPGSARGSRCLALLIKKAAHVRVAPGIGYAQSAMAAAKRCDEWVQCVYASDCDALRPDTSSLLCVEELDTLYKASEIKLKLLDYYPAEWEVTLSRMDGDWQCQSLPLRELDQGKIFDHTCVLLVPPVAFERMERRGFGELMALVDRLRGPGGCPWDREQTHESIKPCLLEEAYEVLDAIDAGDDDMLIEELGDLLLQVVFHVNLAGEQARFTMRDVTSAICEKLIYRHPHIFGDVRANTSREVLRNWEQLKKKEKKQQTQAEVLAAVPKNLPALVRSAKVQQKAGQVGFDWDDPGLALDKVFEEVEEVRQELSRAREADRLSSEIGDLLFACVNVARLSGVNAEFALAETAERFTRRFAAMERLALERKLNLAQMTLAQMDALWEEVKNALADSGKYE